MRILPVYNCGMPEQFLHDLAIRTYIYQYFADECRAPLVEETAAAMGMQVEEVRAAYQRLSERHMIYLQAGSDIVQMANPFSALPTRYQVAIGTKRWYANCAWDSLGIAAALQCDAHIFAEYPDDSGKVEFDILDGKIDAREHVVYFALPCRQWYDDIVFT